MNSPLGERGASRADGDLRHRAVAGALGTDDSRDGARRDEAGHGVSGGRAVAEVSGHGRAALDLRGADQLEALDHAGPERDHSGVLAEGRPGHRRADAEAAVLGRDVAHPRDPLDVDDEIRLDNARLELNQHVGAAGEDAAHAFLAAEQIRGFLGGFGFRVAHAATFHSDRGKAPARFHRQSVGQVRRICHDSSGGVHAGTARPRPSRRGRCPRYPACPDRPRF